MLSVITNQSFFFPELDCIAHFEHKVYSSSPPSSRRYTHAPHYEFNVITLKLKKKDNLWNIFGHACKSRRNSFVCIFPFIDRIFKSPFQIVCRRVLKYQTTVLIFFLFISFMCGNCFYWNAFWHSLETLNMSFNSNSLFLNCTQWRQRKTTMLTMMMMKVQWFAVLDKWNVSTLLLT